MGAVALVAVMLAVVVYGVMGTQLDAQPLNPQVIPAQDQPQEFERLRRAMDTRSLLGTAFVHRLEGDAEDHALVVYTVRLKNNGLLPAEMAELVVAPREQDVLCYMEGTVQGRLPNITVAPGQTVNLRCVLLTRSQPRVNTVRNLFVSYYIWGNPFQLKVTQGQADI